METIRQAPGSKDCLACVAAMATGTTVENYKDFCIKGDLLPDQEITFIEYLWHQGFMAGFYFSDDGVHGEVKLGRLNVVSLLTGPALLCVQSSHKEVIEREASHAVYWDGKRIHDPDGKKPDEVYKIISVLPIVINKT